MLMCSRCTWMPLTPNTHELRSSGRYEAIPLNGFVRVKLSRETPAT